jgi:hypothetical protein
MDKEDFIEKLKKMNPEKGAAMQEELAEKLERAKANGKKVARRVGLFLLILFGTIGYIIVHFGYSSRFEGMVYVTDDGGKSKIWIHTIKYFRVRHKSGGSSYSTYAWQKNSLHILDPSTSAELQEIELPASLFPYSHLSMVTHGKEVWFIKPYDSGNHTDAPAAALIKLNASTGAIISQTDDFVRDHLPLQAGIKDLRYDEERREINIETKDGLAYVYSMTTDSLVKESGRFSPLFSIHGVFFLLLSDPSAGGRHRQLLNIVRSKKHAEVWTDQAIIQHRGPDTRDSVCYMEKAGDNAYMEGRILAQDGKHALILHRTEIGDNGEVMISCMDDQGKKLWTLTKDQVPVLATLNRKGKESFFSYAGQISNNTRAQVQGDTFIIALDLTGAIGVDIKTGAVKWVFNNPYDSRS